MPEALSRASLLRGRLRDLPAPPRPPWALPEPAFLDACTRCGDCARACPEAILVGGSGGFPEVDFQRGACTFCGACVEACDAGAFASLAGAPWHALASIGVGCIAREGVVCRVCEEACEPRAITFRPRIGGVAVPEVDRDACTGCGACVSACPLEAIEMQRNPEGKR